MKPVSADTIAQAANLLRQGRLVAFPTETVYGLGADASNADAVTGIFKAKGRPANHPLIVHISSIENLKHWAIDISDAALTLAEHFWPGPLAMILNKQDHVPLVVTGGQQTIGLRMPNHPVALALLEEFGGGIAAPSANRFCRISPTQASHVYEELGPSVDMILDGGACQIGVESTIIDLSGSTPKLLRPGQISIQELAAALQVEIMIPKANIAQQFDTEISSLGAEPVVRAPGMMEIHYAPTTPATRCASEQLPKQIEQLIASGKKIGLLTYRLEIATTEQIHILRLPQQADAYAQRLYASLRELDALELDLILVEQPPQTEQWSAINDRLWKATIS